MEGAARLTVLVYLVAPSGPTHEYLLLRRLATLGGFWQGVSGAVEPGEALDEAAIRELVEETGIAPTHLVPVDYHYTISRTKRAAVRSAPEDLITEHVFLALLDARVDPRIDPSEHDAWGWYAFEDALTWLHWRENIEALRRCEALLTDRQPPRRPEEE
jgi:8-oxo-dGTP pyrophosphatase MutT (NUDIX family)